MGNYKYKKVVNQAIRLSFDLTTVSANVAKIGLNLPADAIITKIVGVIQSAITAGTGTTFKLQHSSSTATTWADITANVSVSGLATLFVPAFANSLSAYRLQGYNEIRLYSDGTFSAGVVDFYIEYYV